MQVVNAETVQETRVRAGVCWCFDTLVGRSVGRLVRSFVRCLQASDCLGCEPCSLLVASACAFQSFSRCLSLFALLPARSLCCSCSCLTEHNNKVNSYMNKRNNVNNYKNKAHKQHYCATSFPQTSRACKTSTVTSVNLFACVFPFPLRAHCAWAIRARAQTHQHTLCMSYTSKPTANTQQQGERQRQQDSHTAATRATSKSRQRVVEAVLASTGNHWARLRREAARCHLHLRQTNPGGAIWRAQGGTRNGLGAGALLPPTCCRRRRLACSLFLSYAGCTGQREYCTDIRRRHQFTCPSASGGSTAWPLCQAGITANCSRRQAADVWGVAIVACG